MVLISYDISNNKKRRLFNKYISKFGRRVQFSVYEIDNSKRILNNIVQEISNNFAKKFDQTDSIYIYNIPDNANILKFGYAKNDDNQLIIL